MTTAALAAETRAAGGSEGRVRADYKRYSTFTNSHCERCEHIVNDVNTAVNEACGAQG